MASSTAIYHQVGQPRGLCKVALSQALPDGPSGKKEDLNKTNLQSLMDIPRTKFWADEGVRRRPKSFSQPLRNITELAWVCTFWWRHRQQSIIKKASPEVCVRWFCSKALLDDPSGKKKKALTRPISNPLWVFQELSSGQMRELGVAINHSPSP